jgi:hypothetical protein
MIVKKYSVHEDPLANLPSFTKLNENLITNMDSNP